MSTNLFADLTSTLKIDISKHDDELNHDDDVERITVISRSVNLARSAERLSVRSENLSIKSRFVTFGSRDTTGPWVRTTATSAPETPVPERGSSPCANRCGWSVQRLIRTG